MNAARFITILRDFLRRRRPVLLGVECHPADRAKLVATSIQSLKGKPGLFCLPGYAPDPNPDEFAWNSVRRNGTSKIPRRKTSHYKLRGNNAFAAIRQSPALVRTLFMLVCADIEGAGSGARVPVEVEHDPLAGEVDAGVDERRSGGGY